VSEPAIGSWKEILRPWRSRIAVGLPIAAGAYQFLCDQFDFPKLPALWGMTGVLVPWWGWMLIAILGANYALFEYVRRIAPNPSGSSDGGEISRLEQRIARIEERQDGAVVAAAVGRASNRPPQQIKLTNAERERVSQSLLGTLDYLEGDFEDYIAPIRALRIWPGILRTEGPQGVQEKAELALSRLNAFPQTFPDALKRFLGDLKLVGIDPLTIEATAMSFGSSVHSIGSVAYAMKPDAPNEAAFQLSSNTFIQAYDQFQQELDKIKQQITETRHKISSGDLG